jgi:voltage-gated potassium channel
MGRTETKSPTRNGSSDSVYELFILALTAFSLLMVAAYVLVPLTAATKQALLWLDLPISLIFLADAFRSLRRAASKGAYLKWGWLDFLGSIPLILPLRFLRLRRLVQALRALRGQSLRKTSQDLDRNRAKSAALFMLFLALVVLTAATIAVLEFESRALEANILTGHDALWWSIVTMSTVGYGDFYPGTAGGRLAALALMTVGIGIYGVLASYLANFFLPHNSEDDGAPDLGSIQAQLDAVNTQLDAIQALLADRPPPHPGSPGPAPAAMERGDQQRRRR